MTFEQRYPTGRKNCAHCKRWRPVCDFSVRKWLTHKRDKPHSLQSNCHCCERIRVRTYHGHKQRQVFNPYRPGSKRWNEFRTKRKREQYAVLSQDSEWMERRREYANIRNNSLRNGEGRRVTRKGFKIGVGSRKLGLDAVKVGEFFDRLVVKVDNGKNQHPQFLIKGKTLTDGEVRSLYRWRNGEYATAAIQAVDELCLKFEIPLWEIEEYAKISA